MYTMKYYATQPLKDKIMPFMTMRMGPKSSMLSEVTQTEKDKNHKVSLYEI